LDYTYGLGRIYTEEEIQAAKATPSFEREYNLKYRGLIGDVFQTKDIDAAIKKGKALAQQFNKANATRSLWVDPGFGSSAFGVCITELVDGIINIFHTEEYSRLDFNEMIETTHSVEIE
jgi:hypothetical protein